jgi:hypothetical protein
VDMSLVGRKMGNFQIFEWETSWRCRSLYNTDLRKNKRKIYVSQTSFNMSHTKKRTKLNFVPPWHFSPYPRRYFFFESIRVMGNILSHIAIPLNIDYLACIEECLEDENQDKSDCLAGKDRNRHRNRGHALEEVEFLSERDFSSMFHMNRDGFQNLLNRIPLLPDINEQMAKNSYGSIVSKATKLYSTLRYLAGGSFHDICFAWSIAQSTFLYRSSSRSTMAHNESN